MSAHASKRERPPINPAMLRWARRRSGKTIDDAAKKAGTTPERVSAWEIKDSDARPTVRQARRLADLYGRQFVEFFRANPPDILEPKLVPDFRMYRGADDRKDVIGLKEIQGWAEAKRINALDLFDELGEQPPKLSKKIFTTIKHDEEHSASMARKTINFAISEQLNLKASERYKLPNILRGKLESAGMLVLKRADIKSLHARGICIAIFPLPVIVFGNEAPAAQAFTLAHEFAHVLLKRSGIIGGFARAPEAPNWAIERWCNAFAASFLMPADQLIQMIGAPPKRPEAEISDEQLSAIANLFHFLTRRQFPY